MNITSLDNNIKPSLHKLMEIFGISSIPKNFSPNSDIEYYKSIASKINAIWSDFGPFAFSIDPFGSQYTLGTTHNLSRLDYRNPDNPIPLPNGNYYGVGKLREFIANKLLIPNIVVNEIYDDNTFGEYYFRECYPGAGYSCRKNCRRFEMIFPDNLVGYRSGPILKNAKPLTFREMYFENKQKPYQKISTNNLKYEDLNSANCTGMDFTDHDLVNADLRNAILDNANFWQANTYGACFYGAQIRGMFNLKRTGPILDQNGNNHFCNLNYEDLINIDINNRDLRGADLIAVRLNRNSILNLNLDSANLQGIDLRGINCSELDLSGIDFIKLIAGNSQLRKISIGSFYKANLSNSLNLNKLLDISSIDWRLVNLSNANLKDVDFSNTILEQVNFNGAVFGNNKFINANLLRAQLVNCDLTGIDFTQAILSEVDFSGSRLTKTIFSGAQINKTNFNNTIDLQNSGLIIPEMSGISLMNVDLTGLILNKVNLIDANLSGCDLNKVQFIECNLTRINFNKVKNFSSVKFIRCNLSSVNLKNFNLSGMDFSECNLTGVILKNANIKNTNFSKANLSRIKFEGIEYFNTANYSGASFSGVDLSGINLNKLDFGNLDLSGADLSECFVKNTNFSKANLSNVNFTKTKNFQNCIYREANLKQAKFIKCDLREVDFSKMNLSGVNFIASNLEGVNFIDCQLNNIVLDNVSGLDQLKIVSWSNMILANLDFNRVDTTGKSFAGTELKEVKNLKRMGLLLNIDGSAFDGKTTYEMVYEGSANLILDEQYLVIDLLGINLDLQIKNITDKTIELTNQKIKQLAVYYADQYSPYDKERQDFNNLPTKYLNYYLASKELEALGYGIKLKKNIWNRSGDYFYLEKSYHDSWSELQRQQIEQILAFWGYVNKTDRNSEYLYELLDWDNPVINEQIKLQYILLNKEYVLESLLIPIIKKLAVYYADQYSPDDKERMDYFNDLPAKYLNSYLASKELEALGYGIKLQENIWKRLGDFFFVKKSYHDSWSELQRKQIEQILAFWGYVKKIAQNDKYLYRMLYPNKPLINEQIKQRYIEEYKLIREKLIDNSAIMLIEDLFIELRQAINEKYIEKGISLYYEISNQIDKVNIREENRLDYKNQLKAIKRQLSYL